MESAEVASRDVEVGVDSEVEVGAVVASVVSLFEVSVEGAAVDGDAVDVAVAWPATVPAVESSMMVDRSVEDVVMAAVGVVAVATVDSLATASMVETESGRDESTEMERVATTKAVTAVAESISQRRPE